jgi:Transposase
MLAPRVRVVRRAARTHPCPTCGKRGRRKRHLRRRIRSLAYRQEAFLDVHYAEYQARCPCRKSFRSWPIDVPPRSDYDDRVRTAVLDRLLEDGLNVERTRASMRRDFLLSLSSGFVYDCLDWQLARLSLPGRRRRCLESFSGTLCVDELHLGKHTLLLATDPLSDEVVGFALVKVNDQAHLRRFLLMLKHWGFLPRVVISDGSNLYPAVLQEVWPRAAHQLCVFHVLKEVTGKVLDAVRRLRRACRSRGRCGRKRVRPGGGAGGKGPRSKDKAAFIFKRRYLVVKRREGLSERERADLEVMFGYEPQLKTLWRFSQEAYQLWRTEQSRKVARWRWGRLKNSEAYQAVPELKEVLRWLEGGKMDKTQAFTGQPAGQRQKTNNHVERVNRRLRFDEKARYKWRKRKSIVRFVLLRISRHAPRPKPKANDQPPSSGGG